MRQLDFRGRWVVVTGASSGLGESMARYLTRAHGAKLVLVARRGEQLERLRTELVAQDRAEVDVLPLDLAAPAAAQRLFQRVCERRQVYALISNAAAYWYGDFCSMSDEHVELVLRVNVHAPIELMRRFVPYFHERGQGGVLVVTSIGALMPSPMQALYSGSKAMLESFVCNLRAERGRAAGVVLSTFCPGGMSTPMLADTAVASVLRKQPWIMRMLMAPETAAALAVESFRRGESAMIPGFWNRLLVTASRVLPQRVVERGAARVYGAAAGAKSRCSHPVWSVR